MKTFQLALVGLVILNSAALAQSDRHKAVDAGRASDRGQYSANGSSMPGSFGRTVKNPNECAPDMASPVWGPASALVGYTCVTVTN